MEVEVLHDRIMFKVQLPDGTYIVDSAKADTEGRVDLFIYYEGSAKSAKSLGCPR